MIQPGYGRGLGFGHLALVEPLGLEMVAAALKGHQVKILDLRIEYDLQKAASSFNPDLCGISCSFTTDVYQTIEIATSVKRNGRGRPSVFVGGHHASLNPSDFYHQDIDGVVIGEGEPTVPELVTALAEGTDLAQVPGLALNRPEGQSITPPRKPIENLDDLPLPARHLTHNYRKHYYLGFQKPMTAVETARGCPHRCSFCSVWKFYQRKCRMKTSQAVVKELASLKEKNILFTDDNFFINVPRAEEIALLLKEWKLKKRFTLQARSDTIVRHPELISLWKDVGLWKVFIGFEKIRDEELRLLNKWSCVEDNDEALKVLRGHGVEVVASFIVDPDWKQTDFEGLRRYILNRKIYSPSLAVLTPLPGTDLFAQLKGKLITHNYELFDLVHAVLPTRMELPDFYRKFADLYKTGYIISRLGRRGLKTLTTRWFSLFHFLRISNSARMMFEAGYYLAGHKGEARRRYHPIPDPPAVFFSHM